MKNNLLYTLLLPLLYSVTLGAIFILYTNASIAQYYREPVKVIDTNTLDHSDSAFYNGINSKINEQYEAAIKSLNNHIKYFPQEPASYFQLGDIYSNHYSNKKEAIKFFKKAYELNSDNVWYRKYYADALANNGDYSKAINIYERIIEQKNYSLENFRLLISYCIQGKQYNKALNYLDSMALYTELETEHILNYKLYVNSYKGDEKGIQKNLEDLYQLDTTNYNAKIRLAQFYQSNNQYEKADNIFGSIAKSVNTLNDYEIQSYVFNIFSRNDYNAFTLLADELFINNIKKGKIDESRYNLVLKEFLSSVTSQHVMKDTVINHLIKIANTPNSYYEVPIAIGAYYQYVNKNMPVAISYYKKAIEYGHTNSNVIYTILDYYIYNVEDSAFEEMYHKAFELNYPRFSLIIRKMSMLSRTDTTNNLFIDFIKNELSQNHQEYDSAQLGYIYSNLASGYNIQNQIDSAIKYYDISYRYDDSNFVMLNNFAWLLVEKTTQYDKAETLVMKALNIVPKNDGSTLYIDDTYAWILYKKKEYDKAYEVLADKVAKYLPDEYGYYERVGDIELARGNKKSAISWWKKASLKLKEENQELAQKIKNNE